jgi:hypothetical protein
MPRLGKHDPVEIKLDSGAAMVHAAIPPEMRRGLFERPGDSIFAVVQLTSTSYTGHADGEEKDAQVKVRITLCEVALDNKRAEQIAELMRALMRYRKTEGTFDGENGIAEADVEIAVADALRTLPTEAEYEAYQERKRRGSRIEQHA